MNVRSLALVGVAFAIAAGAGCSAKPPTQFTVGVQSQIQVPKDLKTVRITASAGGTRGFCATYPVEDGIARLPQSLALAPGGDPNTPVTVTVIGFEKTKNDVDGTFRDECLIPSVSADPADVDRAQIVRRSKQPYAPAKNIYVPMPLKYSCYGVDCKDGQTCKGGTCVDPTVDLASLPVYAPDLLYGNTSTCFDEDACLGDAIGPTIVDAAQCIYELPPGSSLRDVGMNVRAVFEGGGVEVLDLGDEGFTLPDTSKPNRFRLAAGVCHPAPGGRRIANVNASRTCVSKNAFQPMCAKSGVHLRSAASALYILMDRDDLMGNYIGPAATPADAIDKVLGVALTDPVFSRTKVALKLVPVATPNECAAGGYKTPDTIPNLTAFSEVWEAAGPLSQFLRTTPTSATAKLAADVALTDGATTSGFTNVPNHKTLLLVTNRDPGASTCNNMLGANIASLASQKIDTWVLSLRVNGELPADLTSRQSAVKALEMQGARVISAESADTTASQLAVVAGLSALVGHLGACVYEKPGTVDPNAVRVSFKPPTSANVDVPYASTCTEGANVDGWNVNGDVLRICGASCNTLRAAVATAGQINTQHNISNPTAGQQVMVFVRSK
jgi:hypothetical protein